MTQFLVRKWIPGLVSTIAALLASEAFIRILGQEPWQTVVRGELRELTTEQDPILGWKNRPGRYRFKVGKEVATTILPDGSRWTGSTDNQASSELVLFGDSVMYGYGVDDAETIGAVLQTLRPQDHVVNRAVPGYGLLQSSLAARAVTLTSNTMVVVNAEMYLEERDVATPEWVELLTLLTTNLNVFIPYGTLDINGKLEAHPAEWYWTELPLRTHSAVVKLIERGIAHYKFSGRAVQVRTVSLAALSDLNKTVIERGAKILVTGFSRFLTDDVKAEYEAFLTKSKIPFKWCVDPRFNDPKFHVQGDPHPNAEIHRVMAECVNAALG